MPYPLPRPAYSESVVREVAAAIVAELGEPADADATFAASPRVPPPGDGWLPLPYLSPRLRVRLPWLQLGNPSGSAYALLRFTLLWMANAGVAELHVTPMSTSAVGRIRFLRLCPS